MKKQKRKWQKFLAFAMAAAITANSGSISMYLEAAQDSSQDLLEKTETKKLYVHSRVGGKEWRPDLSQLNEELRRSLDFYVKIENTEVNDMVGDQYSIQWLQEDGSPVDGTPKDAGKYTVKIILDDSLSQTAELVTDSFSFQIFPIDLKFAVMGLYYKSAAVWADGDPVMPNGPYVANSSYTLPEENYELAFAEGKNCTEVGMGYLKIVGKGPNVVGEKQASYQIIKRKLDEGAIKQGVITSFSYDGTGKQPVLEGSYEGVSRFECCDKYGAVLSDLPSDAGTYQCMVRAVPEDPAHYDRVQWYQDYEITPRKLEADIGIEKSKVYDSSTSAKSPVVTVKNVVADDAIDLTARAEYDTKQAGKTKRLQ